MKSSSQCISPYITSLRSFSSSSSKDGNDKYDSKNYNKNRSKFPEPRFQVHMESDQEDEVPVDDIKFHALQDHIKIEMYLKHRADPDTYSYKALSKEYNMSLARSKAILYLMNERNNKMIDLTGNGIVSESSNSDSGGVGCSVNIIVINISITITIQITNIMIFQ